ncbi:Na(+)-translocating ferredoxin:NAD(+) oxidoreductase complex subunit E [subsurface metagenome]
MSIGAELSRGIFRENPVFRLVLGICPTLAVTTSLANALGMGLAAAFVLLGSNVAISLLRGVIPAKVRIPAFIVIISTFVTIIDLMMAAFMPNLHSALGIFIPLIVVNCIIMGRAEAFASKAPVGPAIVDALGMGIGFTLALALIGAIRELFGNGTLLGFSVPGLDAMPAIIFILPPGAFLTMGLLLGLFNFIAQKRGL